MQNFIFHLGLFSTLLLSTASAQIPPQAKSFRFIHDKKIQSVSINESQARWFGTLLTMQNFCKAQIKSPCQEMEVYDTESKKLATATLLDKMQISEMQCQKINPVMVKCDFKVVANQDIICSCKSSGGSSGHDGKSKLNLPPSLTGSLPPQVKNQINKYGQNQQLRSDKKETNNSPAKKATYPSSSPALELQYEVQKYSSSGQPRAPEYFFMIFSKYFLINEMKKNGKELKQIVDHQTKKIHGVDNKGQCHTLGSQQFMGGAPDFELNEKEWSAIQSLLKESVPKQSDTVTEKLTDGFRLISNDKKGKIRQVAVSKFCDSLKIDDQCFSRYNLGAIGALGILPNQSLASEDAQMQNTLMTEISQYADGKLKKVTRLKELREISQNPSQVLPQGCLGTSQ